jgi:hypothetical protein
VRPAPFPLPSPRPPAIIRAIESHRCKPLGCALHTTPVSLLDRLRQPAAAASWDRFVELYTPLLYH